MSKYCNVDSFLPLDDTGDQRVKMVPEKLWQKEEEQTSSQELELESNGAGNLWCASVRKLLARADESRFITESCDRKLMTIDVGRSFLVGQGNLF